MPRTEVTGKQIKDSSVSLTDDVAGVLPVSKGGSGVGTLPTGSVLLGAGAGAVQAVYPGPSGNLLTSNGSTWVSTEPGAAPGGSYSTQVGNGSSTTITVTHNLNTRVVKVAVYDAATWAEVECDVALPSPDTATLTFAEAPATNAYEVVVLGTPNPQGSYADTVGDGSSTAITVTHNLNTRVVVVSVYEVSTWSEVECDVSLPSVNTTTLTFASAPASNSLHVAVMS